MIRGERRMERDQIGFDIVKQPVAIGLSFLPEDALNLDGSTGGHLDVAQGAIMLSEDQHAVGSCFEVEHKIDEMFRVVEVKFQACDGSSDSNQSLMVLAWSLKQLWNGDNFNNLCVFNGLRK